MRKVLVLAVSLFFVMQSWAQTSGTLSVSVTTSSTGGNYAPRNVVAIWIEDSSGKFVKTLLAYANSRITHLNTWEISSATSGTAYNRVDAITGATQNSHGTRTCTWNGTDYTGKLVADGEYKIKMELTDKNSTGNTSTIIFTKSSSSLKLNPANQTSFSSISLIWTPLTTGIESLKSTENIFVYPNPGKDIFNINANNFIRFELISLSGSLVSKGTEKKIDLKGNPPGIYLAYIITTEKTYIRKIIKE